MKTEKEIRDKINEYIEILSDLPWWEEETETRLTVIDALLWVLGDKSGTEI